MEGDGKLEALVDNSLLDSVDFLVAVTVCSLSVVGALRRIVDRAGKFSQPLCMLFLQGPPFLQECREILIPCQ